MMDADPQVAVDKLSREALDALALAFRDYKGASAILEELAAGTITEGSAEDPLAFHRSRWYNRAAQINAIDQFDRALQTLRLAHAP